MGRPRSDARQRLVRAAGTLLQRRGYRATGIKDVAAEAGVPIGSVYFHFPGGKHEIVLAALSSSGTGVERLFEKLVAESPDTTSAVRAYVSFVRQLLGGSGYSDGCPLATTVLEAAAEDAAVADVCNRAFRAWSDVLQEQLVRDGYSEAQRLATAILAALEGALVLARAARDPAPLDAVADEIGALLALRR